MRPLSLNTQAILLLTAPLISGRQTSSADALTSSEYRRLAQLLLQRKKAPGDLLGPEAERLIAECAGVVNPDRMKSLLDRGFALAQGIDRWEARSLWVVSRADDRYPMRLKARLREDAPPVLYGAGDAAILDRGGLAVVGSRKVDEAILSFAEDVGRLTASARRTLISGGARGVDQAAMRGAAEEGGMVAGVLADRLEKAALQRDHRDLLMDDRLVLISPYDPSAGFNVGHAMQRNKLIYALADAALVVSSDYQKGGTWAGAVEQLEKRKLVPVYVRSNGQPNPALDALRRLGARAWPSPSTPDELDEALASGAAGPAEQLALEVREPNGRHFGPRSESATSAATVPARAEGPQPTPADERMEKVRELILRVASPQAPKEVAERLGVSESQARAWLERLVEEGAMEKLSRPVRYRVVGLNPGLFDR